MIKRRSLQNRCATRYWPHCEHSGSLDSVSLFFLNRPSLSARLLLWLRALLSYTPYMSWSRVIPGCHTVKLSRKVIGERGFRLKSEFDYPYVLLEGPFTGCNYYFEGSSTPFWLHSRYRFP